MLIKSVIKVTVLEVEQIPHWADEESDHTLSGSPHNAAPFGTEIGVLGPERDA